MKDTEECLLANAAQYLIDGGEEDAASVLLSCELTVIYIDTAFEMSGERSWDLVEVELAGPRFAYEIIINPELEIKSSIAKAFEALSPFDGGGVFRELSAKVRMIDIEPDWRRELLEIARGKGINNQAQRSENGATWKNLRFRSGSEIKIAQALEKTGVLFLPNCLARLGMVGSRQNREADFLVCQNGKWGILEVDGLPFHPPSRTVEDHERDRLFKLHGITLIEHFDSNECYKKPDEVVCTFLTLLKSH
jgi:hypothetical protein